MYFFQVVNGVVRNVFTKLPDFFCILPYDDNFKERFVFAQTPEEAVEIFWDLEDGGGYPLT